MSAPALNTQARSSARATTARPLLAVIRVLLFAHVAVGSAPPALGDEPAEGEPAPTADPAKRSRAQALVDEGRELLEKGDVEGALSRFRASRAVLPGGSNTINAGICLQELGRYDEALDLYAAALARFPLELDAKNRADIAEVMTALSKRVATLEIDADVTDYTVAIDGAIRGDLPDSRHVRVLGGARKVTITKNGFLPFVTTVEAEAGRAIPLRVELRPIGAWLRVEDEGGSSLFIDGARVGLTPWEGTLIPGRHVLRTERGDVGSELRSVTVVAGKIIPVSLSSRPLGGSLRVVPEPPAARVRVNDVDLGVGPWSGRLPVGHYKIVGEALGYHTGEVVIDVARGDPPLRTVRLALKPDSRYQRPAPGPLVVPWVSVFGGYALGPSLGSDAEARCPEACVEASAADGYIFGARVGLLFPPGLSAEVEGGYLSFGSTVSRDEPRSWPAQDPSGVDALSVIYRIDDHLLLRGFFAGAGVSYRLALSPRFELVLRASGGALLASSRDAVQGSVSAGGQELPVQAPGTEDEVRSTAPYVASEISPRLKLGPLRVGVTLGARAVLRHGPPHNGGSMFIEDKDRTHACDSDTMNVDCTPEAKVLVNERAYGPLVVFTPGLEITYAF